MLSGRLRVFGASVAVFPSVFLHTSTTYCSSTERRGSARDLLLHPGRAHLYWENTPVLLAEQDATTSGASLSCQTTVGSRHQLSPQSTMKGGLVAGRHTSWTIEVPLRETAAPVFK